jgi:hypothetical protein
MNFHLRLDEGEYNAMARKRTYPGMLEGPRQSANLGRYNQAPCPCPDPAKWFGMRTTKYQAPCVMAPVASIAFSASKISFCFRGKYDALDEFCLANVTAPPLSSLYNLEDATARRDHLRPDVPSVRQSMPLSVRDFHRILEYHYQIEGAG